MADQTVAFIFGLVVGSFVVFIGAVIIHLLLKKQRKNRYREAELIAKAVAQLMARVNEAFVSYRLEDISFPEMERECRGYMAKILEGINSNHESLSPSFVGVVTRYVDEKNEALISLRESIKRAASAPKVEPVAEVKTQAVAKESFDRSSSAEETIVAEVKSAPPATPKESSKVVEPAPASDAIVDQGGFENAFDDLFDLSADKTASISIDEDLSESTESDLDASPLAAKEVSKTPDTAPIVDQGGFENAFDDLFDLAGDKTESISLDEDLSQAKKSGVDRSPFEDGSLDDGGVTSARDEIVDSDGFEDAFDSRFSLSEEQNSPSKSAPAPGEGQFRDLLDLANDATISMSIDDLSIDEDIPKDEGTIHAEVELTPIDPPIVSDQSDDTFDVVFSDLFEAQQRALSQNSEEKKSPRPDIIMSESTVSVPREDLYSLADESSEEVVESIKTDAVDAFGSNFDDLFAGSDDGSEESISYDGKEGPEKSPFHFPDAPRAESDEILDEAPIGFSKPKSPQNDFKRDVFADSFDIEATQEFNLNDIMSMAREDDKKSDESGMVDGDDIAGRLDSFFS